MAQTSNEITQTLFEAIDTLIGERIKSLPYDQTIVAQITDDENHANGVYRVTHDYNTDFIAYADYTGFTQGDYVYVRIPEGDYTQQKVITGKYLEGLITASETHNILTSGDANYYVYDKNNLIHSYNWAKEEHEIKFTYFNSVDKNKTWKDVLNLYVGNLIEYERPKAIKVSIGGAITVYLHKYRTGTSGSPEFFAAEQENITPINFMPDVEQGERYVPIRPDFQWYEYDSRVFNPNLRYYTRTGDNINNYEYTYAEGLTEFVADTKYYIYTDISIPTELTLYYKDGSNNSEYLILEDHLAWDKTSNLYYYSSGKLELEIPSSLPMISEMSIHYDKGVCIQYKISPEYTPANSLIPITIQFCPLDETYNVSNNININFGYLTELNDEINVVIQLCKQLEEEKADIIPAIPLDINNNNSIYFLQVLLIDKNGNNINPDLFHYEWNYYLDNQKQIHPSSVLKNKLYLDSNYINTMNKICYQVNISIFGENDELQLYRTCYYPLAFVINSAYYANIPTIITYNQSGTDPKYYNSLISINAYSAQTSLSDYTIRLEGNSGNLNKNILNAYNYLNSPELDAIIIKDSNNTILWYQTIVYIREKQSDNTLNRDTITFLSDDEISTEGVLIARTDDTNGFLLSKDDIAVTLDSFNKDVNEESPIFHLGSDGTLKIGYTDFTMTGHITEGATYIEDSNKTKYTVGNNLLPVYFSNGIPVSLSSIGNNKSFIYLTENGFQSQSLINNNNKIITSYTTSHIKTIESNFTLDNSCNGQFIKCNNSCTITFPNINNGIGFECEIYNNTSSDNKKITFVSGSGVILYCIDKPEGSSSLAMTEPRGVVVAKYVEQNHWLLSGSVEENS